ncbi:hypothetical protein CTI14_37440 [Methylobacterium radiotolerans]|nr:hypothetical protein CTI14_37440 [Methylobacterium radiotolerans]
MIDARVSYESGPWLYALNVTNLTDKTYIPSICYNGACNYGEPRRHHRHGELPLVNVRAALLSLHRWTGLVLAGFRLPGRADWHPARVV